MNCPLRLTSLRKQSAYALFRLSNTVIVSTRPCSATMTFDGVCVHTTATIGKLPDRIELSLTAYEAAVLPLNYGS